MQSCRRVIRCGVALILMKARSTTRLELDNVYKAAEDMGLNDLNSELVGERQYYRDLIYEFWLIFDGLLRAIKGVEINVDLSGVKPHRTQPCRWSPRQGGGGQEVDRVVRARRHYEPDLV